MIKRIVILVLAFVFMVLLLCACTEEELSTSTSTSSIGDSSNKVDLPTTTENLSIMLTNDGEEYYPEIKKRYTKNDNVEIPDEDGWFFEIITSLDRLDELILIPNVDPDVFENNYIIYMKCPKFGNNTEPTYIGYYGMRFENGEYSVTCDVYAKYRGDEVIPDAAISSPKSVFFAVPKNEIGYVEGVQKINVIKNVISRESVNAQKPNDGVELPEKSQLLILNTKTENELGLTLSSNLCYDGENATVLYLKDKPSGDFVVVSTEIINGDLYITLNNHSNISNNYTEKNSFYQLDSVDVSSLRTDYAVFVTVNTLVPPSVAVIDNDFTEEDAIWRAKTHFEKQNVGCTYETNVTESPDNRFWYVTVSKTHNVDGTFVPIDGESYQYIIEKATLDIYGVTEK